jgi:hypothetical protein
MNLLSNECWYNGRAWLRSHLASAYRTLGWTGHGTVSSDSEEERSNE